MFSNHLVTCLRSKLKPIALYSTVTTRILPIKYSISSLFQKKEEPLNVKFETVKADDINTTIEFIQNNYFHEDPLCKSLFISSSKSRNEGLIIDLIRDSLSNGMSIVARDKNSSDIIGASINNRNCPWDAQKLEEYAKSVQDGNTKKLFYIWALVSREPRLHTELEIKSIFEISILAMNKKYSGRGIGTELAKRSLDLGRDLNFSYARMDCTSNYSMKIAEKLGMKRLWDVSYKNILMQDGKTPLVVPEYPHSHVAVYYTYLKDHLNE